MICRVLKYLADSKSAKTSPKSRQHSFEFIRPSHVRVTSGFSPSKIFKRSLSVDTADPSSQSSSTMKISAAACLVVVCLSGASAFVPQTSSSSKNDLACLEMSNSRRQILQQSSTAAALLLIGSAASSSLPAFALETYLTEPTEEFKENERKAMEFRRQQIEIKKNFNTVLERLNSDSTKSEEDIVAALKELRTLVVQTSGLPNGLKKTDLIKQVRSKKAKGFWPTNCEIAYVLYCDV